MLAFGDNFSPISSGLLAMEQITIVLYLKLIKATYVQVCWLHSKLRGPRNVNGNVSRGTLTASRERRKNLLVRRTLPHSAKHRELVADLAGINTGLRMNTQTNEIQILVRGR